MSNRLSNHKEELLAHKVSLKKKKTHKVSHWEYYTLKEVSITIKDITTIIYVLDSFFEWEYFTISWHDSHVTPKPMSLMMKTETIFILINFNL